MQKNYLRILPRLLHSSYLKMYQIFVTYIPLHEDNKVHKLEHIIQISKSTFLEIGVGDGWTLSTTLNGIGICSMSWLLQQIF